MVKPTYIHGEILPPLSPSAVQEAPKTPDSISNEHLNLIATWLDDRFEIPGTSIRFGLDALIGWIPGIGDALAALASLFLVFAAWKRGAARITVLRMMLTGDRGYPRCPTNRRGCSARGLESEPP